MYEKDTQQLLKECNSGIKMAIDAIAEVLPNVRDGRLREKLLKCKSEHDKLGDETHTLLTEYGQEDEEPGMIAKGMSWMKTNMKMTVDPGDNTIADLISSGCDMGVRSLYRYLNKCKNASEKAKDLVRRVISLEEDLSKEMHSYL